MYGTTMWHLFCMGVLLSFLLFFLLSWSLNIFWKAHLGYLQFVRVCSRWCNSSFSSLEVEQTAFALCVRELITLYLQARLWWLSNCRYWSVWVGFLYTLDVKVIYNANYWENIFHRTWWSWPVGSQSLSLRERFNYSVYRETSDSN